MGQVAQVVVGEALELGPTGPDRHQQGVVDEAVGEHQAVAIGQGADGGDVGLKATGEEQHPLAAQPG